MFKIFFRVASIFGLDKAIIFTSSANILRALGSVISVILVVKYLTPVEQGFYYTFASISAIQIFFELGLNGIITQYVAHEVSNLNWGNNYQICGELKFLSRLSSLLRFCVKWYLFFAFILVISLIVIGIMFFGNYDSSNGKIIWLYPWIILAIGSAINLLLSSVIAFIQGLGKVKEIAKILLISQFLGLFVIWGCLIFGAKLYIPGIASLIGPLLVIILLLKDKYYFILKNIWRTKSVVTISYYKEIFPYQWKIALSWISGYFIFQLFNPVIFATEGAIAAGQMGMTLAALNGILAITYAWITTKIPLFSGLIAKKEYNQLDNIFNKSLSQSVLINLLGILLLFVIIFFIRYLKINISGKPLGNRFLNYFPLILMMIPVFLNQFVNAWATYLRCHKKEPFLLISVVGGILCLLSTILLGKNFGILGVTAGYCAINIILFPWAYNIFKTKKLAWHKL